MAVSLSTRPLYLQLRDVLAERIATGEWKPGIAIPNETDLAREFGVSPGTMRKALGLLEGERLVNRQQGRGTFVNDQGSEALAIRFSNLRGADGVRIAGLVQHSQITEGRASELECQRLRLRAQEPVYRTRRLRLRGEQPFMVEETSLPAALFPGLAAKRDPSHRIAVLAQQYGMLLGKASERVAIDRASPGIAEALGIAPGTSLMLLDRVVETLDGRPVEWRLARCHLASDYYLAEMS